MYTSERLEILQLVIPIEDTGFQDLEYMELQLKNSWQELQLVQRNNLKIREFHMEQLADYYANVRNTTRVIETKKIIISERTRNTTSKHKLYLKERHGMICNLLIPDYRVHNLLAIIGALAFTLLIQQLIA